MSLKRIASGIKNEIVEEDFDIFESPQMLDLYDAEIARVLDELRYGPHADEAGYKMAAESLKNLSEARTAYARAKTEQDKVDAQRQADNARRMLDVNQIAPIVIKTAFALGAIAFWIALEQGRPIPTRLATWTTNVLLPR